MTKDQMGFCVCLAAGVALTLAVLASLASFVLDGRSSGEPTVPQAQWVRIEPEPLALRLGLVGRIVPGKLLTIAAPFNASIEEIHVAEGQRVELGQTLLVLDTTQLDIELRRSLGDLLKAQRAVQDIKTWSSGAEVARARRTLATARLGLSDTERKLAETRALLARGIVARMEVDALEQQTKLQRLDLAAAEADLKAATARGQGENKQLADMELENATAKYDALAAAKARRKIAADFAGIVVRAPSPASNLPNEAIQPGARVSEGQSLLGLASVERIKAVAKVDEADINQLREAQAVEISGDGFDGTVLQGQIESVGVQGLNANGQNAGASYEVTVGIPPLTSDQQTRVRLGMSARLSIIVYRNDTAVIVPATAIFSRGKKSFLTYRRSLDGPSIQAEVATGRPTPAGVEVFGVTAGYVDVSGDEHLKSP